MEQFFLPGAMLIGILVGFYMKKVVTPPLEIKVGDLGLSCSHTEFLDDELEEVDVCPNKALTIRNGNAVCKDHEEDFIDQMIAASAPDDLGELE